MKLDKLEIQGFKSFKKAQTFTFPEESGLYYLGGENKVDIELESNGAGKSSLLDAVNWVLYGKTAIGLRASDAASWDRNYPCVVSLRLNKSGIVYTITRTWSPNSLKVYASDEKPEIWAQEELDDLIGLNQEAFLRAVLFSQFGEHFFDLKPAEKTRILVPILNLGIWERCAEIAVSNRSQVQGSLNDTRMTLSESQGYLEGLKAQDYSRELLLWQEAHDIKEKELKKGIYEKMSELKELKGSAQLALKEQEELKEVKTAYTEQLSEIKGKIAEVIKERDVVSRKRYKNDAEVRATRRELSNLEALAEEGVCPKCKQEVGDAHLGDLGDPLFKELELFDALEATCLIDMGNLEDRIIVFEKEREETELQGMDMLDIERENIAKFTRLKTLTLSASSEVGRLKKTLALLQDEFNPYVRKQKYLKVQLQQGIDQIAVHEKDILALQEAESKLNYWTTGFKKLRLFVMREILAQFSMEVNNSLQVLGLAGWEIVLQLDKENKSGTIKNEFTVFVKGPENEKFVNWDSWSGGERQRLRFAGDLGLANLIKASKGVTIDFEFYDEPTSFLSGAGIKGELAILKERALAEDKRILLIDHKNMEDFDFTGTFKIIKDKEGSRFV